MDNIKLFEGLNIDDEAASRRSSDASNVTTMIATPDQQAVITRGDVWDFSQSVADAEKASFQVQIAGPAKEDETPSAFSLDMMPGFEMIVPPKPGTKVKLATMFDLPYEILESIVSLVAGSQDRKWPQVVFFLPRPGQKPVDPGPTNHLCTLMQVSKTLNEVAGSALYSRLTWTDIASGALRIMSPSKIDHLAQGRNIRLTYHDTGANRGSLFLAESLQPVKDVYLRIFGLPESTRKLSSSCHPVYCPIVQQIIPQTLVVWTRNLHLCTCRCYWESNCQHLHSYNLAIAKYYHPYPIQNLIVRVGKLSAWNDEGTVIAKIQTWFRSFVKTRSVVFMVDNPYIWNTTKAGRKRDMRYNPEDNLHPWVSMFMKSLLEYSLGDYAKDITVVNIGSIRSETLGLAEEYWKIKADFKCERCYAEKEFEKLFMLKYGKQLSDRTGSELRPIANVKFIPFSEYLDTYDWRGTVSRVEEKYYIHEYDERRFVKGRGYIRRTCHKCDHPEEELDIKEYFEDLETREDIRRDNYSYYGRRKPLYGHNGGFYRNTGSDEPQPRRNGVLDRPKPW